MDDKNAKICEQLPIIDKTEFGDHEFPDELNNKKAEISKEDDTNE